MADAANSKEKNIFIGLPTYETKKSMRRTSVYRSVTDFIRERKDLDIIEFNRRKNSRCDFEIEYDLPHFKKSNSNNGLFTKIRHRWLTILSKNNKIRFGPMDSEDEIYEIIKRSKQYGIIGNTEKLKLANLIRDNQGCPPNIRKDLWMLSSGAEKSKLNNPGYYSSEEFMMEGFNSSSDSQSNADPSDERPLLNSYPNMPDIYKRQIKLDLDRTFSDIPEIEKNSIENLL
jgi:hypothetical protein